MHASSALLSAQQTLPFPIAHSVRRLRSAATSKDQYEQVLRAAEVLATTLGLVVVAALREDIAAGEQFAELKHSLSGHGTTFGNWVNALSHIRPLVREETEPLAGLQGAVALGKKGAGLISDLQLLAGERNNWAHGRGPQTSSAASERLAEIFPALERSVGRAEFLRASPWIVVESCSLRRGQTTFSVTAGDAMSDHPDFELRTFKTSKPLAEETVYMMARGGPIDMTPLVVVHDCPECHQTELCHADGLDRRGGLVLKSFARGHAMTEPDLAESLRDILGAA